MFCVVRGYEELGLAKIIDVDNDDFEVEYFDSPNEKVRHVVKVHKTKIIYKQLGTNTRVYYFDEVNGFWLVGRVIEDLQTDGGVEVRFADNNDQFIKYYDLHVRCKKKICDSVDYLANKITETPMYAETRSAFLANYIAQRGGVWGISALLSSVIELESHQINVVSRVLSDPCQRYLLADEVGLGKTIEAGVIIRQAVLDDLRNHFVVILVPRALVHQWREELTLKFGLKAFIDVSVFIVSYDSITADDLDKTTLLVIDEAHHLAALDEFNSRDLYDLVSKFSQKIERLLLLSATPILRNELGFLRILHLLDPVVYKLNDIDAFRIKIKHRQALAEIVAALEPENALFLPTFLGNLIKILPNDVRLIELSHKLIDYLNVLPDENDPDLIESIRILRAHLSETYRLHRRILRNRRKKITGLTPQRKGSYLLRDVSSRLESVEVLIEQWRVNATLSDDAGHLQFLDFFWKIIDALLSNPSEIKILCETRIHDISKNNQVTFQDEVSILVRIIQTFDQNEWLDNKIETLISKISELLNGSIKVVIFCSNEISADIVFEKLNNIYAHAVVRHEVKVEDDEFELPLWINFNTNPDAKIIVCDHKAEEGINLQGGEKIVIHFDLPIEPNRIEQRMGRVDRYCAGKDIQSIIMIDVGSKYQLEWYQFLNGSLKIFDRSISSLQYLIEEKIHELKNIIFSEGIEALQSLSLKMGGDNGDIAVELRLIDQQDSLDELAVIDEYELESIFDVDSDWQNIRRTTIDWACKTLMFDEIQSSDQVDLYEPAIRFGYRVPGHGGEVSLIPISTFIEDFLGALDYDYRLSNASRPLSFPHLSRRQAAVKSSTRIIRYGDDFIEALNQFTDFDDRGRSYAMWRHIHTDFPNNQAMYFRFDFLIETDIEYAKVVLKKTETTNTDTGISAILRRGDALYAPRVIQIWVDEDGHKLSQDFIEKYLNRPYDKHANNGDYTDKNLKSLRFISLMQKQPDFFINWYERCFNNRNKANDYLHDDQNFEQEKMTVIDRARKEDEIRFAQLETRIQALEGIQAEFELKQLQFEKELNEALYKGITRPSIRVDVAGVVILANCPYEREFI